MSLPIDPTMISTTDSIAGYRIKCTLGVAEGFFLTPFSGFTLSGKRDILKASLREAILDMLDCAGKQGANAIIGVRYQPPSGGDQGFIVYGTAVKAEKIPYGAE